MNAQGEASRHVVMIGGGVLVAHLFHTATLRLARLRSRCYLVGDEGSSATNHATMKSEVMRWWCVM